MRPLELREGTGDNQADFGESVPSKQAREASALWKIQPHHTRLLTFSQQFVGYSRV